MTALCGMWWEGKEKAEVTRMSHVGAEEGPVPELGNAGAHVEKEGAKMHLIFGLVKFTVFVGHPGWDVLLERKNVPREGTLGNASRKGVDGRRGARWMVARGDAA